MKTKIISFACFCCILLLFSTQRVYASDHGVHPIEGELKITRPEGVSGGYRYDSSHRTYYITEGGEYTVSMKEGVTETQDIIEINSNTEAVLTLENLYIDASTRGDKAALLIHSNSGDVEIRLSGKNTLISGDNAAGLQKNTYDDKLLTIKSASPEAGSLTARGGENAAGIGGGNGANAKNITVESGAIEAYGGRNGAGIGGGNKRGNDGGAAENIVIKGGIVIAAGGEDASGIGSGREATAVSITIIGGDITATGGTHGAGIGSGLRGSVNHISIDNGIIKATGGPGAGGPDDGAGAGIGSGAFERVNKIVINGGEIHARSTSGAGIGSGYQGNVYDIKIAGGEIDSETGDEQNPLNPGSGAAIGSGAKGNLTRIYITGGTINAVGSSGGAGIGGGYAGKVLVVTITGGNINAIGGHKAAGIGSGFSMSASTLFITGGNVKAKSNAEMPDTDPDSAQDIGRGKGGNKISEVQGVDFSDSQVVYPVTLNLKYLGPLTQISDDSIIAFPGTSPEKSYSLEGVSTDKDGMLHVYLPPARYDEIILKNASDELHFTFEVPDQPSVKVEVFPTAREKKAPEAKQNLVYSGVLQNLLADEPDIQGGHLKYKVVERGSGVITDSMLITEDLPQALNAGLYTVYYYPKAVEGFVDGTISSFDAKIEKAQASIKAEHKIDFDRKSVLLKGAVKGVSDSAMPTGNFMFMDVTNAPGALLKEEPLSGGSAQYFWQNLEPKIYKVRVDYGGDENHEGVRSDEIVIDFTKKNNSGSSDTGDAGSSNNSGSSNNTETSNGSQSSGGSTVPKIAGSQRELKKDQKEEAPHVLILPRESMKRAIDQGEELNIKLNEVEAYLKPEMLKELYQVSEGMLKFEARFKPLRTLSQNQKSIIGDRPIMSFEVQGQKSDMSEVLKNHKFKVAVPYTLRQGEKPENLLIYRVKEDGKLVKVTNSVYNESSSKISFVAELSSAFAIGYVTPLNEVEDIQDHWAKNSIEFVMSRDLLKGLSKEKFGPDENVTRAMFVTVLGRVSQVNSALYQTEAFSDIAKDSYYYGFANWAYQNSITRGVGELRFDPSAEITREQAAVMLDAYMRRILKENEFKEREVEEKSSEKFEYADSKEISDFAKEAVEMIKYFNLMTGKRDAKFHPKAVISRAELAAIIERLIFLQLK